MSRKQPPPPSAVHASSYVRCPNGHARSKLVDGRDAGGRYVEARCIEPGCGARQRVYASEVSP